MEIDANHLDEEFVASYRKLEKERLNGILNKYLSQCQHTLKVWFDPFFLLWVIAILDVLERERLNNF